MLIAIQIQAIFAVFPLLYFMFVSMMKIMNVQYKYGTKKTDTLTSTFCPDHHRTCVLFSAFLVVVMDIKIK